MDVSCIIIELKPNSKPRVEEWASFILSNKEETLSTLKNEGVTIENFFLATIESKDYLIGYMRAKSMEKARDVVKTSLSEIDAYHKQFQQDCWVKGIRTQSMLELNRLIDEDENA